MSAILLLLSGRGSLMSPIGAPVAILLAILTEVLGFWLLRGAPSLMSFAYPDDCPPRPRMVSLSRDDIDRVRSAGQAGEGETDAPSA